MISATWVYSFWIWNCCVAADYRVAAAVQMGLILVGFSLFYGRLAKHAFAQAERTKRSNLRLLVVWTMLAILLFVFLFFPSDSADAFALQRGLTMFGMFLAIALCHAYIWRKLRVVQ